MFKEPWPTFSVNLREKIKIWKKWWHGPFKVVLYLHFTLTLYVYLYIRLHIHLLVSCYKKDWLRKLKCTHCVNPIPISSILSCWNEYWSTAVGYEIIFCFLWREFEKAHECFAFIFTKFLLSRNENNCCRNLQPWKMGYSSCEEQRFMCCLYRCTIRRPGA